MSANEQITAFGWEKGAYATTRSSELQIINAVVLSDSNCQSVYAQTPRQFCIDGAQGTSTCKIGTGGAVIYTEATSNISYFIGVVGQGGCSRFILNAKMTTLLDWIENTTLGVNYCRK